MGEDVREEKYLLMKVSCSSTTFRKQCPPFYGKYPLKWSLECVWLFDVQANSTSPPLLVFFAIKASYVCTITTLEMGVSYQAVISGLMLVKPS